MDRGCFVFASSTDKGPKYAVNQDSLGFDKEHSCFVLADGVGGHQGGEIASSFVVEKLLMAQVDIAKRSSQLSVKHAIPRVVLAVDQQLKAIAAQKNIAMGTTLVTGLIIDQQLHYTHVGDSRLYLMRNNLLALLTRDDTLKQQVLDSAEASNSTLHTSIPPNIVTQALGLSAEINVHYGCLSLKPGDLLLSSTDGLHDCVALQDIETLLAKRADLQQCADDLVHRALKEGTKDNISVLLIESTQDLLDTLIYQVKSKFR